MMAEAREPCEWQMKKSAKGFVMNFLGNMTNKRKLERKTRLFILFLAASPLLAEETAPEQNQSNAVVRSVGSLTDSTLDSHVRRIDEFVQAGLKEQGVRANSSADDAVFLRRAYLEIVGRIPNLEEARSFFQSSAPRKRRELINRLLDSEGYVNREFHYWADLLRAQSRLRNAPGQPYLDWIQNSLRENKPYDQMVRELIQAEGYVWENGAAGYYLRDAGMPLDHMANTFQVFLGTQLVCAQCHDHPYDEFTQLDYYRQAAYVFGVKTTDREVLKEYRKINRRLSDGEDVDPEVHQMARRMIRPLRYRVNETNAKLKLPDDYQYDDAKPNSVVKPVALFGDKIELERGESQRDGYANWLTSAENPRFATVIANRLWKRVMGAGLIEPVDDLADGYSASHPELMNYLTEMMIQLNFNLRDYFRVLYNTQTWQRNVSAEEWKQGRPYYFPGPLLKRMSAEQLWDSVIGLIVQDVDERRGRSNQNQRYYDQAEQLEGKSAEEILAMAAKQTQTNRLRNQQLQKRRTLQRQINVAKQNQDWETLRRLQREQAALNKKTRLAGKTATPQRRGQERSRRFESDDPRWRGIPAELVRASKLPSPAPARHFLRQFGQSDRETIENANDEANVPQILTLLNGPIHLHLWKPNSLFHTTVDSMRDAGELLDAIYLTILSRRPSPEERELLLPEFKKNLHTAAKDLAWVLLNTRQFAFIQ